MISVIISSYNSEKTIKKTLESLNNQTNNSFECIFIDGKSSDNTLNDINNFVKILSKKNINTKVISEKDNGIYDAWNKGIKYCTGDFIIYLNSDDWFNDNTIESIYSIVKSKPNYDAYFFSMNLYDELLNFKKVKINSSNWGNIYKYKMPFNFPAAVIKKECYEILNGFDTSFAMSGDYDLITRAILNRKLFFIDNKINITNMRRGGVTSNMKNLKLGIREDFRIWNTYQFGTQYFFLFRIILIKIFVFVRDVFK